MSESRSGEHQELEERFQSVLGYVMGFFLDGQLAFRSPEAGAWTPVRVSQETGDTAPCSDIWQLGSA